jgi:biotin transport system substrate-specific component
MTNTAASTSRPVLADRLVARGAAADVALVLGGVAVVSALAQVQIPLWPVPVTGRSA